MWCTTDLKPTTTSSIQNYIQIILIVSHGIISATGSAQSALSQVSLTAASTISDAHVHGDVPFGGRCATGDSGATLVFRIPNKVFV